MKSTNFLFLVFLSTTASAALLHRPIPQDHSFPGRIRRAPQKAHLARSPSPQGPPSNPGEFIDPALSHANPQNNPPPTPAAIELAKTSAKSIAENIANAALGPVASLPAISSTVLAISPAASSIIAGISDTMNPTTSVEGNANVDPMSNMTSSGMDSAGMDAMMNTTSSSDMGMMDNGTMGSMDNSTSSYAEPGYKWNGTLYYNTTDGQDYIDTVYPNGTETITVILSNTTEPYGMGNTTLASVPTATGFAALPGQTGSGPERLVGAKGPGFKPGFTGPKGRRWLHGIW